MTQTLAIVLAAGEGKRMRSTLPKVLHKVGGLPILGHVLRAARESGADELALVIGPELDANRDDILRLAPEARLFVQTERRGTGHAASMAREAFSKAERHVIVVYGDHPLLRGENFSLVTARLDAGFDAAVLGFEPADPTGYGRLLTEGDRLVAIREHKDASEAERAVGLCNACILAFRADLFRDLIDKVGTDNAQGEYYLTDLVSLANAAGARVGYALAAEADVMGVNDRTQLARAETHFQQRRRAEMLTAGVTLWAPDTVYFSHDTAIAPDVEIEPNVVFGPGVTVETGAVIHAFSHLEGAHVGQGATVGPFARLRPGADLADKAKAGNFVEIKKAHIGKGAKINHLTYIGDAEIGAGANIGAGTVTCNYDGHNKAMTIVGSGAFIGSNSALVAPVTIGEGAYVGSGSVITEDVAPDALGLGRARQVNKPGYGKKLHERLSAAKKS